MTEATRHASNTIFLDSVDSLYSAGWLCVHCENKSTAEEHGQNAGNVLSKIIFQ